MLPGVSFRVSRAIRGGSIGCCVDGDRRRNFPLCRRSTSGAVGIFALEQFVTPHILESTFVCNLRLVVCFLFI